MTTGNLTWIERTPGAVVGAKAIIAKGTGGIIHDDAIVGREFAAALDDLHDFTAKLRIAHAAELWLRAGIDPRQCVAGKGEHPNEAGGQFEGKGRGVFASRGSGEAPELLKAFLVVLLRETTLIALVLRGLAVAARLALHEDEFDVVFDDGVRLAGFAGEAGPAVFHLVGSVGYPVPDDGIQVIETQSAASDADVRVEWEYDVAAKAFA